MKPFYTLWPLLLALTASGQGVYWTSYPKSNSPPPTADFLLMTVGTNVFRITAGNFYSNFLALLPTWRTNVVGLSASTLAGSDGSGKLDSISVGGGLTLNGGTLSVDQQGGSATNVIDVAAGTNVTITTNGLLRTISAGNGANGTNGVNGLNGTNGVNGVNGTNGATGPQGPQGPAGANGTNGVNGINGTNGAPGAQGPPGTNVWPNAITNAAGTAALIGSATGWEFWLLTGDVGAVGAIDTVGFSGDGSELYSLQGGNVVGPVGSAVGSSYATNFVGQLSPTNFDHGTGASGATFWRGDGTWGAASGPQGPPGTNGTNGINGTNGATGPQGPQGIQGPQGPAGTNGTNGVNGINGTNGATGPQGPQGVQGPQGPAGTNGTNGVNGINGTNGATGPQGPQGVQGPQGPAGTNGSDATAVWPVAGANVTMTTNDHAVTVAAVLNGTNVSGYVGNAVQSISAGSATHASSSAALDGNDGAPLVNLNGTNVNGSVANALSALTATTASFVTQSVLTNHVNGTNVNGYVSTAITALNADDSAHAWDADTATAATRATGATYATNVVGQLSPTNYDHGTGASGSTFLRGDGTWATPAGTGGPYIAQTSGTGTNTTLKAVNGDVTIDTSNPGVGANFKVTTMGSELIVGSSTFDYFKKSNHGTFVEIDPEHGSVSATGVIGTTGSGYFDGFGSHLTGIPPSALSVGFTGDVKLLGPGSTTNLMQYWNGVLTNVVTGYH